MSYWRPAKKEDLNWNEEEQVLEVYSGSDNQGSRYVEIPKNLLLEIYETIKNKSSREDRKSKPESS